MKRVVYREVPNCHSNDFNKEPPTRIIKYFVVGESKDGKSWLVESAGWRGKKNRHYIKKSECTWGGGVMDKTCKNISEMHPTDGFTCSACGITIIDFREERVDEEDCTASWYEYEFKYCPNCGAKVVEE